MFIGIVFEITDILPSARMCAGAKGFDTVQTSLVKSSENLASTSCNGGRKYERWFKTSQGQSIPIIASRIASSKGKTESKQSKVEVESRLQARATSPSNSSSEKGVEWSSVELTID